MTVKANKCHASVTTKYAGTRKQRGKRIAHLLKYQMFQCWHSEAKKVGVTNIDCKRVNYVLWHSNAV